MSMNQEEIDTLMKELDNDYKESQKKLNESSTKFIEENKSLKEKKLADILSIVEKAKSSNSESQKKSNIDKIIQKLQNNDNDSVNSILSNLLDYSDNLQENIDKLKYYNDKQINMLFSLNKKFPNLKLFELNLSHAKLMKKYIDEVNEKLIYGNKEISHIINLVDNSEMNSEKIDNIVSKIKDLSIYINEFFGDELDN